LQSNSFGTVAVNYNYIVSVAKKEKEKENSGGWAWVSDPASPIYFGLRCVLKHTVMPCPYVPVIFILF
jgi:hypothetical protein